MAGKFVIRLDDAFIDQYTLWKPYFDSHDINVMLCVLAGEVGVDPLYMTWENVIELYNAGWEIAGHGMYTDYGLEEIPEEQAYSEILACKNALIEHGIPICNFVPHMYGQNSLFVRRTALELGFKTCHAGYTTGSKIQANDRWVKIDDIWALRGDLTGGIYQLNDPTGVENTKKEILKASLANRLLITHIHTYDPDVAAGLTEVINYAKSLGVEITTLKDVIEKATFY